MPNISVLEQSIPVAPLKIIAMSSATDLGNAINTNLVNWRKETHVAYIGSPEFTGYHEDNFLVDAACPRFGSGEAKGVVKESVRGSDVYILVDVCNYTVTYKINGYVNHMSPDDHFADLKRTIAALCGHAYRVNVIMPFLYSGRQHKRNGRESLDCAYSLAELYDMGVSNIITFDAHDPRVMNSVPFIGFDSFMPTYQCAKLLSKSELDITMDKDHLLVISPDEGALDRAIHFAGILGVDAGMFYKRRDYSTVVNGKNPIVAHEFLGSDLTGKDVIIVDDMISSGDSMIDTATILKSKGARRVFVCTTFGLFTNGLANFDKAYENGIIERIICTNLTYLNPELKTRPYFMMADMTKFISSVIDFMNHNVSLTHIIERGEQFQMMLDAFQRDYEPEDFNA